MGRFVLIAAALVVCYRPALADPVDRDAVVEELPLRTDTITTLKLSAGSPATITAALTTPGLQGPTPPGADFGADETSLVTSALGAGPDLFDENGEIFLGGPVEANLGTDVVSLDSKGIRHFDWPDFSGVVELLVSESTRNLVSKYRLPGQHESKKKKKKKKTKEEHLMDGKCRTDRSPRSLFARTFHVTAAAFIGVFLVIVVLRKSGRGSYWW